MSLRFIYITNNTNVAKTAEMYGVDRIMVDLEYLGKNERQKGMNTVKSNHTILDVKKIAQVINKSELLVRINPWNETSIREINEVIEAGANRIMLPMWKSFEEVDAFFRTVNKRVNTTLLLETKEAVECLDKILEHPFIDEIHIGLNDLHLSYGLNFMFELLVNGVVETICNKCREKNISFGFGGIAKLGEGMLPAENIIKEHYRLGSSCVILSRSFCNAEIVQDIEKIKIIFQTNLQKIRNFEKEIVNLSKDDYKSNLEQIQLCVEQIVKNTKETRK